LKIKWLRSGYGKLQRKIFLQILLMIPGAWLLFFLVYGVLGGKIANACVRLIQLFLFVDYEKALFIYQYYIRNHMEMFIEIFFVLSILLFFYLSLGWFLRYFRQIDRGMDDLLAGKEIRMSPEMETMERKMNQVRGILERRQMEAKLAEKRKDEMVMYLAHDIRTPLTSVIGYLSLLNEAWDMPEEQKRKYVKITLEKGYRLEELVNEFFEITRYNLQQTSLETDEIDLSYMMIQMADEFYPVLWEKGNTVELQIPEELRVEGDGAKLARVFQNILKNAAAYSTPGTVITVRAEKTEEWVQISFENRGRTIPEEKLNAIFDRFYRLDDARVTKTGGAGLGLAIAKEIVKIHGGNIRAESAEGTTVFTVELPVRLTEGMECAEDEPDASNDGKL